MDNINKLILACLLIICTFTTDLSYANHLAISFLTDSSIEQHSISKDKILKLIRDSIATLPTQDYTQAKVQIVYNQNKQPNGLLVYLLSGTNYSFTTLKINVNSNFKAISVIPNYQLTTRDFSVTSSPQSDPILRCPDKSVEFVAATPLMEYPTARAAVNYVYEQALSHGYKTHMLLGESASIKNYLNLMTCPRLKGFFHVGHGGPEGILLSDGMLSNLSFHYFLKNKLREGVVILFNSCQVDNDPLKSSIILDADAQKYSGGITNLRIGPSEEASKCFWDAGFAKQTLTPALKHCNQKYDFNDVFGIDGQGVDTLAIPDFSIINPQ